MHVGVIFCDLSKGFDCVNNEILLTKLHFYGIQGITAKCFQVKSPKNNQIFFSNWGTTKHGVPQGSILGPLDFITYINDLPPTINALTEPIMFADDTSVIISGKILMISVQNHT
jgi:hypothetical protein